MGRERLKFVEVMIEKFDRQIHYFFRAIHSYIENFYIICLDLDGGSKNFTEIFKKKKHFKKKIDKFSRPSGQF